MRLSDVAELIMGQSPPSSTYNSNCIGLPFYQGKTDFGFISPTPRIYCSAPRKIAVKGDILMSVRAPVGPVNINIEKSCLGRGVSAIRAKKVDSMFLYFYLIFQEKNIAQLGTGSTFQAINKTQLSNIEIPTPPLSTQKKIAHVLSKVQDAIAQQTALIDRTIELKKTIMHKLFTEGTKGEKQKMTEIGLVPESWEIVEIGNVFKFSSGKTRPQNITKIKTKELNIPVYGGNGILGYSNDVFIQAKTLILGRVGEYCGCVHLTEDVCWISDNALYAKKQYKNADLIFIKNKFEFMNLNKYSNKMGQPLITQGIIDKVKFSLPTMTEQETIANILKRLDQKIEQKSIEKQKKEELFKTLLFQFMNGGIVVD